MTSFKFASPTAVGAWSVRRSTLNRNLDIENPGFDEPFVVQGGAAELKLAHGWTGRWELGPNSGQGYLVRPEFYVKYLGPLWNPRADACQGVQSTSATHRACVVTKVALPMGAKNLRVEAMVAYHAPQGGMAVTMGLDGTGQVQDMFAPTVRWSNRWLDQDAGWAQETWATLVQEIDAAETGQLSIWLRSENRWRGRNNHVWWKQVTGACDVLGGDDPGGGGDEECLQKLDQALAILERVEVGVDEIKFVLGVVQEFNDLLAAPPKVTERTVEELRAALERLGDLNG